MPARGVGNGDQTVVDLVRRKATTMAKPLGQDPSDLAHVVAEVAALPPAFARVGGVVAERVENGTVVSGFQYSLPVG